jgi:exodeoxyribonuclease VII small subunit
MSKKSATLDDMPFEAALAELEQVVEQMESDELPLEQLLALYERGARLTQHCNQLLDRAELRVTQLETSQTGQG